MLTLNSKPHPTAPKAPPNPSTRDIIGPTQKAGSKGSLTWSSGDLPRRCLSPWVQGLGVQGLGFRVYRNCIGLGSLSFNLGFNLSFGPNSESFVF